MKKFRNVRLGCGFALLLATVLSCKEGNERACEDAACFAVFYTLNLTIVDEAGDPVQLDRTKVSRIPDGLDITRQYADDDWETARDAGIYVLADDGDGRRLPRFRDTRLRFQGYIGNQEVVNADYVVTFSCCHISLVSGETKLTVK